MKNKKAFNDISAILFFMYIVLSSYSVYMVLFPISSYIQIATILICFVISLFYYLRHPINFRMLLEPVIALLCFLGLALINGSNIMGVFLLGLRLILIYYAVSVFIRKGYDLMYSIYKALFFLAVVFLIFYIIFDILMPQAGLAYYYTYTTGDAGEVIGTHFYTGHYGIYFRWATNYYVFGMKLPRCSGFCWEPGQYQIYLNYVLMYLLYFDNGKEKHKVIKTGIILVAVLSTTSTMGLIVALLLLSGVALKLHTKFKYLLLFVFFVFAVVLINRLLLEKQEMGAVSYNARISELDLLTQILFKNSPLGIGMGTQSVVNSILRFMNDFGYFAVFIIFIVVYYIFKNNHFFSSRINKIIFTMWFALSLINEPILYMNFTFAMVSLISLGTYLGTDNMIPKNSSSCVGSDLLSL